MKHLVLISSSVREGRMSDRTALFLKGYAEKRERVSAEILDLKAYGFPFFTERLAFQRNPSPELLDFTERFVRADGVIVVSPVYNASYPAALKNVIDVYVREWVRKPVGVVSVSSGKPPGIATIQQLQALLLKVGAWVVPAMYTVTQVETSFDPEERPAVREQAEAYADPLLDGLSEFMECASAPERKE